MSHLVTGEMLYMSALKYCLDFAHVNTCHFMQYSLKQLDNWLGVHLQSCMLWYAYVY